jgi:hypothetical protein
MPGASSSRGKRGTFACERNTARNVTNGGCHMVERRACKSSPEDICRWPTQCVMKKRKKAQRRLVIPSSPRGREVPLESASQSSGHSGTVTVEAVGRIEAIEGRRSRQTESSNGPPRSIPVSSSSFVQRNRLRVRSIGQADVGSPHRWRPPRCAERSGALEAATDSCSCAER